MGETDIKIKIGLDDQEMKASSKDIKNQFARIDRAIEKATDGITKFKAEFKPTKASIGERLSDVKSIQKGRGRLDIATSLGPIERQQEVLKQAIKEYERMVAQFGRGSEQAKNAAKNITEAKKALEKLKNESVVAKTKWQKFMGALGRTSVYMLARRSILAIIKAAKEGVVNFIKFDQSVDNSFSNIKNTFEQIKNTLGIALGNLIKQLEPVITRVLDVVVKLVDGFNALFAKLTGQGGFYTVEKSTESMAENLEKAKSLLMGFDKLNILSQDQEQKAPDYKWVSFDDAEAMKEMHLWMSLIAGLGVAGVLGGIASAVSKLTKGIRALTSTTGLWILAIGAVVAAVSYFVSGLDEMKTVTAVIIAVIAAVIALLTTIALIKFGPMKAVALGLTAGAAALAGGTAIARAVPALATGGVVASPTMALIGEGRYNEAVVPLGSSPQFSSMKADIASAVAEQIGGAGGNGQPINITINTTLDGRVIQTQTERYIKTETGMTLRQLGMKATGR